LWVPGTGLAKATPNYDKLTPWDIASVLAATYSARVLNLIEESEYRDRTRLTLRTLERMPLFQNAVFNKLYNARTGRMAGRGGVPTTRGHAWSATDLGRLLLWLHIVARSDTGLALHANRVVRRLKLERVIENGVMHGEELMRSGKTRRFQEGRIGYEQYAARGFAVWGQAVDSALELRKHAEPVEVLGVQLLRDRRGLDRIVSEPFVLLGLELGWNPEEDTLARAVLEVQRRRYEQTKRVTIASEDALGIPPHFFYYYCIYCNGKPFVIDVVDPGKTLDSPRWVSTKMTFGWHSLLPSDYTRTAIDFISKARTSAGWNSGVFERTARPTGSYDINTAAIILEAAAYHRLGRPLVNGWPR
jgi:hypothetical protein